MHKACPLSELAPGEALRLDTAPPIAVFHTEEGELFAIDDTCTHQDASLADGYIVDGYIMVIESDEAPNLPPGLTLDGHV